MSTRAVTGRPRTKEAGTCALTSSDSTLPSPLSAVLTRQLQEVAYLTSAKVGMIAPLGAPSPAVIRIKGVWTSSSTTIQCTLQMISVQSSL